MRFRQSDIKVRMASDLDGERIGEVARGLGVTYDLDWGRVAPYWILAEYQGEIVGATQICLGRPVGRVEMLFLSKAFSHRIRAIAVKKLAIGVIELHRRNGSQLIMGIIPSGLEGYRRLLQRHFGAIPTEEGTMFMVRID